MITPTILESTKPLLYETGNDDWPYSYAGSCFPVRWRSNLYIVSAFHCYEKREVNPEATLYPIPTTTAEYFGFSCKLRAKIDESTDLKHYDQIALQVSSELHSSTQIDSVNAVDLSDLDTIAKLTDRNVVSDAWFRGYLYENSSHAIDHEFFKIKQQAYITNGIVSSRESDFKRCCYVKVKTPAPNGMSPNGMSGSAVYTSDKYGKIRFAGTVIEFNELTEEFLVIDPTVLRELLEKSNK